MKAPLHVGAVLFPEFELLDLFGPLEIFGLLEPRAEITMLALRPGAIASSAGPAAVATQALAAAKGFDVLLVPGGSGTRVEMHNRDLLALVRRVAEHSRIVGTICTGSLLLAMTGLLDQRRATSNKRVFRMVQDSAPKVEWVAQARWVADGKYFTSSGVSAGIDMALAVVATLTDVATAERAAQRAEYEWHRDSSWDPFAKAAGL
jgi:putative intracellular protease/amidase